jgi:hypothetical protein
MHGRSDAEVRGGDGRIAEVDDRVASLAPK